MPNARVEMDAELVDSREGSLLLRLKTGFGDPEIRVSADKVTFLSLP